MFMAGTEGGKIFRCFFDMNDLQGVQAVLHTPVWAP